MSADNWTLCPNCEDGKGVNKDDYPENTPFREDFEIGVFAGALCVHYTGKCKACGHHKNYDHKESAL